MYLAEQKPFSMLTVHSKRIVNASRQVNRIPEAVIEEYGATFLF